MGRGKAEEGTKRLIDCLAARKKQRQFNARETNGYFSETDKGADSHPSIELLCLKIRPANSPRRERGTSSKKKGNEKRKGNLDKTHIPAGEWKSIRKGSRKMFVKRGLGEKKA